MNRLLLTLGWVLLCFAGATAQNLTITSPAGLEHPYEVAPGTSVTFRYEAFGAPTAFFTHGEHPVFPEFGADPSWTQHEDFISNGDGTYDFTLPLNNTTYVWVGSFSSWTNMWIFSDVLEVATLSGVTITAADGRLCDTGDTELLTAPGTYASYQWFFNNEPIHGATAATYPATAAGNYKVQVPVAGSPVFSNTLRIKPAAVTFSGSFAGTTLTLKASAGLSAYQWLQGASEASLAPIASATTDTHAATLTASTVYYAVRGTQAGCAVQSEARPASLTAFAKPVLSVDAPTNSFGKICTGTAATLSVPDNYENYRWTYNGDPYFGEASITVYEEPGPFIVSASPKGWPEVTLSSGAASVPYFTVLNPDLSGVVDNALHCPGETIGITLADEGYDYTWYAHSNFIPTDEDEVTVPGYTYNFTFATATYVTVKAAFQGCESQTKVYMDGYENVLFYLELSDYNQEYLCVGSTVDLSVPVSEADHYEGFAWYKQNGDTFEPVAGANAATYKVATPGTFKVTAHPKDCPSSEVTSLEKTIHSYQARTLEINADAATLCEGEEATLSVGSDWGNIQWFAKTIVIGDSGYEDTYTPLAGAGTANEQRVSAYTTYLVKARHAACPTGLKITSAPFAIRPTLNPEITTEPTAEIYAWHRAPYDSVPGLIFCDQAPLTMNVEDDFASYQWHSHPYDGDDDYAVGEPMENETSPEVSVIAFGARWYTARVEKDGCIGYSRPVLIDTWVHNSPAVESRDNAELCDEGDSTMLNLAFPGNWVKYEWYLDGELVPDSDNDTLFARVPGGYTITGYPSECPHIGYSSGLPVDVSLFPKAWIEENDTVIYAMPELGFYGYEWFLDGNPIEPEELPWIRTKATMEPGTYTVRVNNPKDCNSLSDGYVWTITGTEDELENDLAVHPNPTIGSFTLRSANPGPATIVVYDLQGKPLEQRQTSLPATFDLCSAPAGMYIVDVVRKDGVHRKLKVIRH